MCCQACITILYDTELGRRYVIGHSAIYDCHLFPSYLTYKGITFAQNPLELDVLFQVD
jgi:hypothetical protein